MEEDKESIQLQQGPLTLKTSPHLSPSSTTTIATTCFVPATMSLVPLHHPEVCLSWQQPFTAVVVLQVVVLALQLGNRNPEYPHKSLRGWSRWEYDGPLSNTTSKYECPPGHAYDPVLRLMAIWNDLFLLALDFSIDRCSTDRFNLKTERIWRVCLYNYFSWYDSTPHARFFTIRPATNRRSPRYYLSLR